MRYTPSVNIEYGVDKNFYYIPTPNASQVVGNIVSSYQSGIHSFSIIGSYGTGKSSFLLALERDLSSNTKVLIKNKNVLGNHGGFEVLNIVGDYNSLSNIIAEKIQSFEDHKNIFDALSRLYHKCAQQHKMLLIVVDEFGKVLEHAAKNNPEKELYFIQRLAEFANVSSRNILLLTTLHQNFNSYSTNLSESQRNEWTKVKGRYKEVVFSEPVEQLLFLTAEQLSIKGHLHDDMVAIQCGILKYAVENKFVNKNLQEKTILNLTPLDTLSAMCITKAIQRYGQNERTLFSFLTSSGTNSVSEYEESRCSTYNLANVYDYITYNFFSALQETISDTSQWTAMRVAIERVENGEIKSEEIGASIKIVKAIGLLNLFGSSSAKLSQDILVYYAENAMSISNARDVISSLEKHKLIRYASYKSSYVLFDGTDIDLEDELYKSASVVPCPQATVENISKFINQRVIPVSEIYYRFGTPRYFEFIVKNTPEIIVPHGDVDGYIQIVFPLTNTDIEQVFVLSKQSQIANVYAVFYNVENITKHLYEIHKLQYLIQNVVFDDRVAQREINNQIDYEKRCLNSAINDSLLSDNEDVVWIYNGEVIPVCSLKDLHVLLTNVCCEIYHYTPVIINELFNREKISSVISVARTKLLEAMIDHSDCEDLGFAHGTCPPEKAIYYTLLKCTGMHRKNDDGIVVLDKPTAESLSPLWNLCEMFVKSAVDKPLKISDLMNRMKAPPFKLKQGFIDFWIPIYLFVRQQEFAVYNSKGVFVMSINKEFFELLQKRPQDYFLKAFNVSGVKMEFFKKYQQFLNNDESTVTTSSIIATFKPFIAYYRKLNEYAQTTNKFDAPSTALFRNVLASAKDPEKAFFEDIPHAFGFNETELSTNQEVIDNFLDLIRKAIRELNICYDRLIHRIEQHIVTQLSLPEQFEEYKPTLQLRYKGVKKHLLTPKCRILCERILAPSGSSKEFIEKICNVVLDKRLSQIKDKEEEFLLDNLIFLFRELDQFISISTFDVDGGEVYSVQIASNQNVKSSTRTYVIPEGHKTKMQHIMASIQELLTGDSNIDSCVLLKLLEERIEK